MLVAVNDKYEAHFLIDTGAQISMVNRRTYQGMAPVNKQKISIVGVNGKVTAHPLVRAKLVLANGQTACALLLLGDMDILGMDVLQGQSWVDSWGKWEIGQPPKSQRVSYPSARVSLLQVAAPLPHSKPVNVPQYKLPADAIKPVTDLVKDLEQRGIIVKTHSPFNSPVCGRLKSVMACGE